jgi:hypothetical protein
MTTSNVDLRLREEARRFGLRFGCESCAYFDPEALACSNGYPTEAHRGLVLERIDMIEFCKEFELA